MRCTSICGQLTHASKRYSRSKSLTNFADFLIHFAWTEIQRRRKLVTLVLVNFKIDYRALFIIGAVYMYTSRCIGLRC